MSPSYMNIIGGEGEGRKGNGLSADGRGGKGACIEYITRCPSSKEFLHNTIVYTYNDAHIRIYLYRVYTFAHIFLVRINTKARNLLLCFNMAHRRVHTPEAGTQDVLGRA